MIIDKNSPDSPDICAKAILDGKVVVIPCDTIYGLSSLYIKGNEALRKLKGRDADKPFLVLATIDQAKSICTDIPEEILNIWPAALTVILETKQGNSLGIRVPDDEWLQKLLSKVGEPVYSTSVNISGEPSLLTFSDICNSFEDKVAVCVKGFELQGTKPSTLINATCKPYKVLREGAFDVKKILKDFL